jgi:hypothetical protein
VMIMQVVHCCLGTSQYLVLLLLYAGPDQIMPLVSILGAIVGVLLLLWQRVVLLVRKVWSYVLSKSRSAQKQLQPSTDD